MRWPEDFGTRFTIFVDTEEEFDWSAPFDRNARSVTAIGAIPDMHARFAGRGIGVTYLVDHPVATDARAVQVLCDALADGRSAIGAQLHPWVNPPHEEAASPAASYLCNLPPDLVAAKLDCLTDTITTSFGRPPRAFRAGRYGIGSGMATLLASRGYALDTSMRSRHDYTRDGGPDFTRIGPQAFRQDGLLELPLTTTYTGVLRSVGQRLHPALANIPRGRGLFARTGLLSRVPLTPEGVPVTEALEAIRIALGEGVRVLNFAFHSPSLQPGYTPYVRDAADLMRFHHWWDTVLDLLDARCVRPASLDDLLTAARRAVGPAGNSPGIPPH
ncbi:polysaccharide deacetylase family protein [Sphingomonas sp. SUN019]|nr:polysaccharide deacetylase family protein [Sphingomonas sp. SUN019]